MLNKQKGQANISSMLGAAVITVGTFFSNSYQQVTSFYYDLNEAGFIETAREGFQFIKTSLDSEEFVDRQLAQQNLQGRPTLSEETLPDQSNQITPDAEITTTPPIPLATPTIDTSVPVIRPDVIEPTATPTPRPTIAEQTLVDTSKPEVEQPKENFFVSFINSVRSWFGRSKLNPNEEVIYVTGEQIISEINTNVNSYNRLIGLAIKDVNILIEDNLLRSVFKSQSGRNIRARFTIAEDTKTIKVSFIEIDGQDTVDQKTYDFLEEKINDIVKTYVESAKKDLKSIIFEENQVVVVFNK